jgi:hypothetical protein
MGVTGEALGRKSVLVLVLACELGRGHGRGSLLTRERQAAEWKLGGLLARTPRGFTCRRERRNIPSAMTVGMGKQRFWSTGVGLVFVVAWERLSGLGTVVGLAKSRESNHDAADSTRRRGQSAAASSQYLAISRLRLRQRDGTSNTRDCLHHYIPYEC